MPYSEGMHHSPEAPKPEAGNVETYSPSAEMPMPTAMKKSALAS